MLKILVTGGAGFIGSNFILSSLNAIYDLHIINLDNLSYAGNLKNLAGTSEFRHHFVNANILQTKFVLNLMFKHEIDAVVHFAAESHVDRSIGDSSPFIQTNVNGTVSMLEATKQYLEKTKCHNFKFLHVSTDEVFGSADDGSSFTEESQYRPNSPYSASKAASDHFVRAYSKTHGIPTIVTNCSNNYGPRQHTEKLIPRTITTALQGEKIQVYGDGLNIRDWLHVDDHCEALRKILLNSPPGNSYCIGGNCETTNIELVTKITKILDQLRPKKSGSYADQIEFVKDRPGHDRRYSIDSSKIKADLNWQPKISLDDGLLETVRWYMEST